MVTRTEGGLRRHRLEFVREEEQGEFPTDPEWMLYSDTVRSFEWSPETNIEEAQGLGDADPSEFYKGFEEHELTVEYDLQHWLTDGSGNAQDASYDALIRDIDNQLPNSHTIADREEKTGLNPSQTVNGETTKDTRIYTVAEGAVTDEVTYNGDPGSQNPVMVELTYQAEKVRTYQFDQPESSTILDVQVTDSSTPTVTIEDSSGTSEEVTGPGQTGSQLDDIDSIQLDSDIPGNVEVYAYDDTAGEAGDLLAVIHGSDAYEGTEGDVGTPLLGGGSHATEVGTDYEIVIGDTIQSEGAQFAFDINSVEISVSNNVETAERVQSVRQRIDVGNRSTELSATVVGESESHTKILDHLQANRADITWEMTGGNITVLDSVLMDSGSRTIEAGTAAMTLDNSFTGRGVDVTSS